jgi:hypothetical protein
MTGRDTERSRPIEETRRPDFPTLSYCIMSLNSTWNLTFAIQHSRNLFDRTDSDAIEELCRTP